MSSSARAHGRRRARRSTFRTACASCSAAASLVCPARRSTSCSWSAALARPTVELVAAAQGDRDGVLEAFETRPRGRESSSSTSRGSASHTPCSPRSATSGRRSGSDAQCIGRSPSAVTDVEEQTRHLALAADAPDAGRRLGARRRRRASCRAWRDGGGSRALRAGGGADARRSRLEPVRRRLRSANFHFLAGDRTRSVAILDQLLTEVPSGRRAGRRSLRACLDVQRRRPREDRALRQGPCRCERRRRALGADPGPPSLEPSAGSRRTRCARRCPCGARVGREGRRPRADRCRDRDGWHRPSHGLPTSRRGCSSAAWRSKSAWGWCSIIERARVSTLPGS